MNKQDLIKIREYVPEDRNFILATFLRGMYYGESIYSLMEKRSFMDFYKNIVNQLIDSKNTNILVACLKDDPNTVLGYSVVSLPNVVHYVFVKKNWRSIGIARDLLPKSVNTVTHLTKAGMAIMKKNNLIFNPFLLR
jgi:hypothetical protein